MARPTSRQGSRFLQARKVVPTDLRAILGRTEFKESLPATDHAEVKRMHRACLDKWEGEIAAARLKLSGTLERLTDKDIRALCGEWYRAETAHREANPGNPNGWELVLGGLQDEFPDCERGEEQPPFQPSVRRLAAAETFLRQRGVAADASTIDRFSVAFHETETLFARAMIRRARGDYGQDSGLATFPELAPAASAVPPATAALSFADLVAKWATESGTGKKSLEKWLAAFAGFATSAGHNDAHRVSQAEVRRWKEERQAAGKSAKTISDGIGVMRATVNWGIKNGLLTGPNPFAGMAPKVPKGGPAARDGFTDAEARQLLEAARHETGWLRWLPWLLAFTGCRLSEAAELRQRDIRQEGGTWIMDITPAKDRSLKTVQSQRMVPLHPALIAEGFLIYAASVPVTGPLFPDISIGRYGNQGSIATKAHSRWVRVTVRITDPKKAPAHSWRHRMEDALRKVRAPTEAADAITGHDNPRNAGAGYGKGFRRMPEETLKELEKVPSPLG